MTMTLRTRELKIAFVGAGSMAREHLKAFKDIDGISLAGIYSRTLSKAEALAAEFGISATCASIEDLYCQTSAELVVVAVPEVSIHEVASECLKHAWTM